MQGEKIESLFRKFIWISFYFFCRPILEMKISDSKSLHLISRIGRMINPLTILHLRKWFTMILEEKLLIVLLEVTMLVCLRMDKLAVERHLL